MTLSVGNDMKLYHNTGTNASPVWVLIDIVGDVSVDINIGNAEVDLRVSSWLLGLPTKLSGGMNMALANHVGNSVFATLRGYALARTIKQYASVNTLIATSGAQYFKSFCHFTAFPWNQPTQEVSNGDAQMAFSYAEESSALVEPAWVIVA